MKLNPPTMPPDYYYAFAKFINEAGGQRATLLDIFEFAAKAYTSYRKAEELFENRLRAASPGVVVFEGAEHVQALGNAESFCAPHIFTPERPRRCRLTWLMRLNGIFAVLVHWELRNT